MAPFGGYSGVRKNKANDDALRHGFEQAGPQATGHIKIQCVRRGTRLLIKGCGPKSDNLDRSILRDFQLVFESLPRKSLRNEGVQFSMPNKH
jgi:hypothetical protein